MEINCKLFEKFDLNLRSDSIILSLHVLNVY